jgi:hypothetical protein
VAFGLWQEKKISKETARSVISNRALLAKMN